MAAPQELRLFVAVVPPPPVADELRRQVPPAHGPDGLRWSPPHQWHVTLLFAPHVPEDAFEPLRDGLDRLAGATRPFELAVRGGDAFGGLARARHLVALLDDPAGALPALARGCRDLARGLGLEHAGEPYRPHLTLARTRRPEDHRGLRDWLGSLATPAWQVDELCLVRSVLPRGPGPVQHTVVSRQPL